MLLAEFIRESTASLSSVYPEREASSIVTILCAERLGVKSYTHIVEPGRTVPPENATALASDIGRLLDGEPLQYVLGFSDFCGRRFKVTPDVLIPRPETAELADMIVRESAGGERILDLCTGSGCIAWTLANEIPSSEVVGVDVSPEALAVARAQDLGRTPSFVEADILKAPCGFGTFDVLVSNPPYIMEGEKASMRRNVLAYEPALALFVPDNDPLLFYVAVAEWALRLLNGSGRGYVEINDSLGPQTAQLFSSRGFRDVRLMKDISGRDRFVKFVR